MAHKFEHEKQPEQPRPSPEPVDPWIGRSEGMRCRSCVFYVPKAPSGGEPRRELGRCRNHAPTMRGYPAVFPMDWCGDHRLDENRL